jgi:hypothetical protein
MWPNILYVAMSRVKNSEDIALNFETMWPNILYVAMSRVKNSEDIALNFEMSVQAVCKIAQSDSWKRQHEEVKGIHDLALVRREQMRADDKGTRQHFAGLVKQQCTIARQKVTAPSFDTGIRDKVLACVGQWEASLGGYRNGSDMEVDDDE